MKQSHGWWFPDHEVHLIGWMESKKNKIKMNDRCTYQGQKQIAALKWCNRFRTAVDIGAHVGLWSYNLAHAFSRVVAFEPVAAHRECFAQNIGSIDRDVDVQLHPYALGDQPGWCSMVSETGSSGNTTVGAGDDVEMRVLDDLQLVDVDLMKLDCEGFEEKVLRGAQQTIKAWKPTIVVEQKHEFAKRFDLQPLGAVKLLEGWGYKVVEEISGDYILVPEA